MEKRLARHVEKITRYGPDLGIGPLLGAGKTKIEKLWYFAPFKTRPKQGIVLMFNYISV